MTTLKKIQTIDVNALEWFDKINGNSYFAGQITVDFGLPTERSYYMPFQYGYGSQYTQEAQQVLAQWGETNPEKYQSGGLQSLWSYCQDRGIILRTSLKENCKKRDLKEYTNLFNSKKA